MTTGRLLLATRSAHKLAELRDLLQLPGTELVSLDEVGILDEAPEEGDTFEENAAFKARFYAERSRLPTVADDSGLEVDALGGRPGVHTRRYAGENATDAENNAKLLQELGGVEPQRRRARYRCVLAYVHPSGEVVFTDGTLEGRIALAPRGTAGFGYDPVFEPLTEPVHGRTVGQLTADEKNAISHRSIAARKMGDHLRERNRWRELPAEDGR